MSILRLSSKGNLSLTVDGKEDYLARFIDFRESFTRRDITPIHEVDPTSEFTLHIDG